MATTSPLNRRHRGALMALIMAATGVAQGFGRFSYAVVLPEMVRTVVYSYARAGTLGLLNVGAYLIGTASLSAIGGRLTGSTIIKLGLALSMVGMAVISVSSAFWLLGLGMALAGFGGSLIWVPAPAIASGLMASHRRGLAMGLAAAGIGAAITISSVLAHLLAPLGGQAAWRDLWRLQAVGALIVLILSIFFLKSPRGTTSATPSKGRASDLRLSPGWGSMVAVYCVYGFAYALFLTFFVATAEHHSHITTARATSDYAAIGFISIFGGVLAGRISDKVGRALVMVVLYGMMFGACVLMIVGGEVQVLLAAVAFGLPQSGIPNAVAAHVGDHVPSHSFAAAFGVVTFCFGIFQALATQLGGSLASWTGSFVWDYVIAAVLCLVGAGVALHLRSFEAGRQGSTRANVGVISSQSAL